MGAGSGARGRKPVCLQEGCKEAGQVGEHCVS